MFIRKDNLIACAGMLGIGQLHGIRATGREYDESHFEELRDEMIEAGMLEENEEGRYVVTNLGQFYIDMLADPKICIHIVNGRNDLKRTICLKNYYYIYADERKDVILLDQLLTLELMAGAIAEAIDGFTEEDNGISVEAVAGLDTLTIEFMSNGEAMKLSNGSSEIKTYTEESCISDIMSWIVNELKTEEEDE